MMVVICMNRIALHMISSFFARSPANQRDLGDLLAYGIQKMTIVVRSIARHQMLVQKPFVGSVNLTIFGGTQKFIVTSASKVHMASAGVTKNLICLYAWQQLESFKQKITFQIFVKQECTLTFLSSLLVNFLSLDCCSVFGKLRC